MTGWHIGTNCRICGKFVSDEDEDIQLIHTTCLKAVRRKKK